MPPPASPLCAERPGRRPGRRPAALVAAGVVLGAVALGSWRPTPQRAVAGPLQQATVSPTRTVRVQTPTPQPAPTMARPDVAIGAVRVVDAAHDPHTLVISATFTAALANVGAVTAELPLFVTWFADVNRSGAFESGVDSVLATAGAPERLAPGDTEPMRASGRAVLPFRDAPIWAVVTTGGRIGEGDVTNNVASTAGSCGRPADGAGAAWATPQTKWRWPAPGRTPAAPHALQVEASPVVIDLDRDGSAEVIFATLDRTTDPDTGILRAVDGRTGADRFTVDDLAWRVAAFSAPAVGDLLGDAAPEIVAVDADSTGVMAFGAGGAPLWHSAFVLDDDSRRRLAGPSLADLDGDGRPEILVDDAVLDAAGRRIGRSTIGALAVDLDLVGLSGADGPPRPELLGLGLALSARWQTEWEPPLWTFDGAVAEVGFNAVANLDADPYAEIVVVGDNGDVQLLHHNGAPLGISRCFAGDQSECRQLQRGQGGPPVIADFNGDGGADIGIAGRRRFSARQAGERMPLLWEVDTNDSNSGRTSAAAFDFEGDGAAEVVYADLRQIRIIDGVDGRVRWQADRPSLTNLELPIVADIDGDVRADIVVGRGDDAGPDPGLVAYGNPAWAPARPIWNQHAFTHAAIDDAGRVPRRPAPSWHVQNGFRDATLPGGPGAALPDLTAGRPVRDPAGEPGAPGSRRILVRVGNAGRGAVARGVEVAAYAGPVTGTLLATATLPAALPAGAFVDVALAVPAGTASLTIVVDPARRVTECTGGWRPAGAPTDARANNTVAADVAAMPTAIATPSPTASRTATTTPTTAPSPSPTLEPWLTPSPTPSTTPSPTPTATASATATADAATPDRTPSATASPTRSASPTATATPTPPAPPTRSAVAFLPAAIAGRCADGRPIDAVLVVDVSAHMRERDGDGTRLGAARAAAAVVVDGLSRAIDHRAALVTAGDGAVLRSAFARPSDVGAVLASLAAEPAPSAATPIDEALVAAGQVLRSARPGAAKVVVVIGDGRAWPAELAAAAAAARAAEAAGATVLAIGTGLAQAPLRAVLTAVVGDGARYLDQRARRDAGDWVMAGAHCPPGPWWMGR